jgi:signal transduction histidine kinase
VSSADGHPDPESQALLRRLSHDLRTPLNHIVGALELIELQAHKPADVTQWVGVARQAADRLRTMLDELTTTTEN